MAEINIKEIESKKEWEDFIENTVAKLLIFAFLVLGEFHKNLGKTIKRTGFMKIKITEQCCQLLKMQKEGNI